MSWFWPLPTVGSPRIVCGELRPAAYSHPRARQISLVCLLVTELILQTGQQNALCTLRHIPFHFDFLIKGDNKHKSTYRIFERPFKGLPFTMWNAFVQILVPVFIGEYKNIVIDGRPQEYLYLGEEFVLQRFHIEYSRLQWQVVFILHRHNRKYLSCVHALLSALLLRMCEVAFAFGWKSPLLYAKFISRQSDSDLHVSLLPLALAVCKQLLPFTQLALRDDIAQW